MGVSERRNRTLLDMVRSMMNLTTLPLSFLDYALESAARILNMIPIKKFDKTPYELWDGKVPTLSYLMVWGCEALVKRYTPDKLQQRSVKYIFIGYPKETIGYYFYFPPENKIVVARYVELFEKNLLSQEVSRRARELEEIQDEDTLPSEITSEIPIEVDGFEPPHEEETPVRRSVRTHRGPKRLCLHIEVEEHSLGDLNEPANYKAAILDLESNKWLDAMNAKMQSMKDNQVWRLVDLPPNCFVDPNHPRKVCKLQRSIYGLKRASRSWNKRFDDEIKRFGFAQNLDEPCVYQKASGSNVTFLILYVDDIIIMRNHIPSLQSVKTYLGKCFAMKDLEEATFILGIKIYRDSASTPEEVKRMQNVPYASAVGSIMYAVRCTRPDVAFAQNITSWFQQNPGEPQWTAVKIILKNLRNTKDMFLVYGRNPEVLRNYCYCIAGFETDRDEIKSQTGYVFILNGRRNRLEKLQAKYYCNCMTRSSTKELLSPFENPKQKFRSRRRLFDTPSLVESNSPEFDHNFDIEEQSEEDPSINQDTHFELKGQFLKELRDNTFSGSEHEDANEHIEKVLEIVDLFHIPKITQDQIMLRAFHVSLTGAASRWLRNQPSGSITTWEEPDESLFRAWERFKELLMKCPQHYLTDMQEVILFYNGLDVPTRQILDSKGAIPSKTAADAKIAIQEMAEYSQKWHNGTSLRTRSTEVSDGLAATQAQLNNLRQEIRKANEKVYAAQVGCELCKGPHYTKDCPQKEEGKTLEEAYYIQFGAPYQPGGQYRATGPGFYQRNNGNTSYPDQIPSLEESLTKFMAESAKMHEENSNIIKEIQASTDAAIRNQGDSIKTLEIKIR
ncbi:retrotransposon protein, putative, ty1-copia subclass [Tanacetum coccineum]